MGCNRLPLNHSQLPSFVLNSSIIKVIYSNSARLHNVNETLIRKDPKATKILFCIVGVSFASLALMFNSSVNFVIFCLVGKEFKEEFVKIVCPSKNQPLHFWTAATNQTPLKINLHTCPPGLHKLCYPTILDRSTWSKFGAHGEHGDVFLVSNLGAL